MIGEIKAVDLQSDHFTVCYAYFCGEPEGEYDTIDKAISDCADVLKKLANR